MSPSSWKTDFLFRNRCLFLPPLASFAEKRARPRSPILSSPWKSRNMFFGFRSRCTIPLPAGGTTHQMTAPVPEWLQELCGSPGRCCSQVSEHYPSVTITTHQDSGPGALSPCQEEAPRFRCAMPLPQSSECGTYTTVQARFWQ